MTFYEHQIKLMRFSLLLSSSSMSLSSEAGESLGTGEHGIIITSNTIISSGSERKKHFELSG